MKRTVEETQNLIEEQIGAMFEDDVA